MQLFQIPISHNCVKVRRALELKGLAFEARDVSPLDRSRVQAVSGQGLVPVLDDEGHVVADSTMILRYLEERYDGTPLVPDDAAARAECWLLEDWADSAFMALTRRIAYWAVLGTPGALRALFFADARGPRAWIGERVARRAIRRRFGLSYARNVHDEAEALRLSRLAVDRLGDGAYLVGDRVSVADVALASMSAPLRAAAPELRDAPAVRQLIDWGATILGPEIAAQYEPRV